MKTPFGILLLVVAYFLLLPGLTQPMLSVSGTVEKTKLVEIGKELIKDSPNTPSLVHNLVDMVVESLDVHGTVDAFDKTRSILDTAQELHANGHLPVAILIVLFSAVVPLIKALLLLIMLLPVSVSARSSPAEGEQCHQQMVDGRCVRHRHLHCLPRRQRHRREIAD